MKNLVDMYPAGVIEPVSGSYPGGSLKDEVTPNVSNDGTPLSKIWGNEFEGLRQSALIEANEVATDVTDTATDSQLMKILINMGIRYRENVVAVKAAKTVSVGQRFSTGGYTAAADGGGGLYNVMLKTTADSLGITDYTYGNFIFDNFPTLAAILQPTNGNFNIRQFGAKEGQANPIDLQFAAMRSNTNIYDLLDGDWWIQSGFPLDLNTEKLKGSGAKLSFDVAAAETLLTLSMSTADVNKRGVDAAAHAVDGIAFYGPGKGVGTVRFAVIDDAVDDSIWGAAFRNGGFYGFNRGIDFLNGAFMSSCDNFHGISNGYCFNILTATNAGERNTFLNSTFTNCDKIIDQSNPNSSTMFIGCSLDYTPRMITATGGDIQIIGGHIESNLDTDNWVVCDGADTSIRISNSAIVLNNTLADLAFSPFNSLPSVTMGGIFIDNCELWTNGTFTTDVLVGGTGVSQVKNITMFENSKKPALSRFDTDVAYGDYENANYANDYTLSGVNAPVRTVAKSFEGTHSLFFEQLGGAAASKAIVERAIQPAGLVTGHLYYQTDVVAATATFLVTVNYLDKSGAVIDSYVRLNQPLDIGVWTLLEFAPQRRAPAGSVSYQLVVEVFGAVGVPGNAWIDDLVVSAV